MIAAGLLGAAICFAQALLQGKKILRWVLPACMAAGFLFCAAVYLGAFDAESASVIAENRALAVFLAPVFGVGAAGCAIGMLVGRRKYQPMIENETTN